MLPAASALHRLLNESVVFFGLEPSICMRIPSHCDELFRGEGKVGIQGLGEMANALREVAGTPLALVAAFHVDHTVVGFAQASENIEQSALASAIDAEQSQELSRVRLETCTPENLPRAVRETEILDREDVVQLCFPPPLPCMNSNNISAA